MPEIDARTHRQEIARRLAQMSFIDFIRAIAPWFVIEEVHLLIADALERIARGENDRLMVFLGPRFGKSTMASIFFPAWYLGKNPHHQSIQVSYKKDLAIGFGRHVRDLIVDQDFQAIFPGVGLRPDVKAAGQWQIEVAGNLKQRGEYFAAGTEAGIAGKGFHLGVIDDPLSEQDFVTKVPRDRVWDWYGPGFYTRRQPEKNAIVLMTTRWATDDLAGRLLKLARENARDMLADQWEVLSIPALIEDQVQADLLNAKAEEIQRIHQEDENHRARLNARSAKVIPLHSFAIGTSSAPRRMTNKELSRTKSNVPPKTWAALYQQRPSEDEGLILKRKGWRAWGLAAPPRCSLIVACYDTAFEEKETNDYSARTTWGVFENELMRGAMNIILLERMNKRLAFDDLVENAIQHQRAFDCDLLLIEKRASGHSLIQTLRRRKLPARGWLPPGGTHEKGKIPRAHGASEVLDNGAVWYMDRDWAYDVIDQCSEFPSGQNDDLVDTVTMALSWFRRGGMVEFPDEVEERDADELEEERLEAAKEKRRLYG